MNLLPSAVHVSSVIKHGASGDWEMCFLVIFPIGSFAKHVYMYIFVLLVFFVVCVCFVLCRERRRRDGSRHRLITERAKTDEISVLSLLSSNLR